MEFNVRKKVNDDDPCVVFINPFDAEDMLEKEPDVQDALVISTLIEEGECVVVTKAEFLEWLYTETMAYPQVDGITPTVR